MRSIEEMRSHQESIVEDNDNVTEENRYDSSRYRRFRSYSGIDEIYDKIHDKQPIACFVHLQMKKIYIMVGRGRRKSAAELKIEDDVRKMHTYEEDIEEENYEETFYI